MFIKLLLIILALSKYVISWAINGECKSEIMKYYGLVGI